MDIKTYISKSEDLVVLRVGHDLADQRPRFWSHGFEQLYPELKELKLSAYRSYIDRKYLAKKGELLRAKASIQDQINQIADLIEPVFIDIFGQKIIQHMKVRVHISLFAFYPRNMREYSFNCYYDIQKSELASVLIHELLHFAVYEQLKRRPRYRQLDPDQSPLWDLLEIINIPLMNETDLRQFITRAEKPYPEHRKMIAKISWTKNSFERLIDQVWQLLETEN